ncbi:hypothetical protein [Myroides odoratimimus]|uniref:hypothetical protein n=1 Tax=Myroides odoratimimus TaxID=76832 RepID=UPI003100B2CA
MNSFNIKMKNSIVNTMINFRHCFVYVATILIFISSCAVKKSIKTFLLDSPLIEHQQSKGESNPSYKTSRKCSELKTTETQVIQKFELLSEDLLPLDPYVPVLLGWLVNTIVNAHPLYIGTKKIRITVPLFIEYQRLIIRCYFHLSHI